MKELLSAARDGDEPSRELLLDLTRPRAVSWARALVSESGSAEDIAQEALLEIWQSLESLREPAAYLSWVHLVVRKHADRHRRKVRTVVALDALLDVADDGPGPADHAILSNRVTLVRRMLALAPNSDRRLLDLRYIEGWSDAELSILLQITPGAVRKRLFDARRRLKPSLAATLDLPLDHRSTPMSQQLGYVTTVTEGTLPDTEPVFDETPLPTGVRVLEALLPWPRAGLVDLAGPINTGGLVLLAEVLMGLHHQAPAALVGVSSTEPASDGSRPRLRQLVEHQWGQPERVVVFRGEEPALAAAVVRAGELARAGVTVLLAVDRVVADTVGLTRLARLPLALAHGSVTVVRCAQWMPDADPVAPWAQAHTRIVLSAERALRGVYPAVDLLASSSQLADPALTAAARDQLRRVEALEQWIAQPFMTAAEHTGVPGVRYTAREAITQLKAALT